MNVIVKLPFRGFNNTLHEAHIEDVEVRLTEEGELTEDITPEQYNTIREMYIVEMVRRMSKQLGMPLTFMSSHFWIDSRGYGYKDCEVQVSIPVEWFCSLVVGMDPRGLPTLSEIHICESSPADLGPVNEWPEDVATEVFAHALSHHASMDHPNEWDHCDEAMMDVVGDGTLDNIILTAVRGETK